MAYLFKAAGSPIVWVFTLLVLGLLLIKLPRKKPRFRLGWLVVLAGVLALYLFSIAPVANLLVRTLESRYSPVSAESLQSLDIMVILDGGTYPANELRERPRLNGVCLARLIDGLSAFRKSSARILAVCGGGSIETCETGGQVMRNVLVELGVEPDRIIAETKSRNTMENAIELKKLLGTRDVRHIGLATSASHMPRSVRVFKRVFPEDVIVPIPVDYVYVQPILDVRSVIPSEKALEKSAIAVHEWIGMLWYCVRY